MIPKPDFCEWPHGQESIQPEEPAGRDVLRAKIGQWALDPHLEFLEDFPNQAILQPFSGFDGSSWEFPPRLSRSAALALRQENPACIVQENGSGHKEEPAFLHGVLQPLEALEDACSFRQMVILCAQAKDTLWAGNAALVRPACSG
jgi:hypothetical protein